MKFTDPHYDFAMLDSNALGGADFDPDVERVIQLAESCEVAIAIPFSVQAEINRPQTPAEVKRRASRLIFSIKVNLTTDELRRKEAIRALIAGNAKGDKHDADALHVFEAQKHGRYFITNDKRILGKMTELSAICGALFIVTPVEFLEIVAFHPSRARRATAPGG